MSRSPLVRTAGLGWLAAAAVLAGCNVEARQATPTPVGPHVTTVPASCPVTTVHTEAVPTAVPGFVGAGGPWMGDARFGAFLFYAGGADPTMRAQGRMTASLRTKILWWVTGGGDVITIRGREHGSGRTFSQVVQGIGGGQFPSVPVVPTAGCWTLTESVDGQDVGAITIPVIGPLGT